MKKVFILLCSAFMAANLFAGTKSAQFNAMIPNKKAVVSYVKGIPGVKSVKVDQKKGVVTVKYNDKETTLANISGAMSAAGIQSSSIGENCALKPGGCLNNAPTVTNTMR
ncbi:MAG: hypothetical protein J6K01_06520 [Paludibacteraceae bacterium]|jgi:copper chaperone CopZ|nr:hypothetical protein [Bacteroidales bacterium]MBP3467250.1 hypothetical protein [Paludibacteraceae bacterium]MBQ1836298.1 hypothetical protein [Paludibacteraceae bacterium]MBQ2591464.1 hypothetical protein [Paludibacteraceae bacterium]MBQ3680950.1 hypothetical protein [Paludibacteraceae bacterium]